MPECTANFCKRCSDSSPPAAEQRMRPIWARPTTASRSMSSKLPEEPAKLAESRARSTPSGRFMSKIGSRQSLEFQEASRTGMVTETARAVASSGSYAKVPPRFPCRSRKPACWLSVQMRSIALFFRHEVFQCRTRSVQLSDLQVEPKCVEQSQHLFEPDPRGPGILERIDPRPADTGLPGQVALSETLPLASSLDHVAQFDQIGHTRTTIEVKNSSVTSTMGNCSLRHKAFLLNWRYLPQF